MSNSGRNSNGSQFFLTFCPLKKLDGKHCIFGEIIEGIEVLDLMLNVPRDGEKPLQDIIIADCGKDCS